VSVRQPKPDIAKPPRTTVVGPTVQKLKETLAPYGADAQIVPRQARALNLLQARFEELWSVAIAIEPHSADPIQRE